ncbi:MAG: UvrB/UvrC motif-containing protein [Elusimicrobiota bacterium]|nr:UvrB/UvrC motif-containing protein [Elusimicrobiota bacterium]MDH5661744.1 UvrB/UvrC motif-containing protein [Elusimicrobiota bacterium]
MRDDISEVLQEWEYNRLNNIRKIKGKDGKEKIQIRLPLGIEQFEVDGRPDGKRPYGKESLLEYYKAKVEVHKKKGTDEGFGLTIEDCSRLYEEGLLYYYRYVLFFQLKDYERLVRDTERNIEYFDFVNKYAIEEEDKLALQQYRPYIIRMNILGKGLAHLEIKEYEKALKELQEGIRTMESLSDMENATFTYEKGRSLSILRGMVKEILGKRPPSEKDKLQKKLQVAIEQENYERAAQLRDIIQKLEKTKRAGYKRRDRNE